MATVTAGNFSIDLSGSEDPTFDDLGDGTSDGHTDTKAHILGASGDVSYILKGTGLANFGSSGIPHAGTLNSFEEHVAADNALGFRLAGFSITAAQFLQFVNASDVTGFLSFALSGNDAITGSKQGDFLFGYAGDDTIFGGGGADRIRGGAGADHLIGGAGRDIFILARVNESTSTHFDTIGGIDFDGQDRFDLPVAVTAIDASVSGGELTLANFDATIAGFVDAGRLHQHHAIIYSADSGTFAGAPFLIVDANGEAGYQPGKDFVFFLDGINNFGALDTADFI